MEPTRQTTDQSIVLRRELAMRLYEIRREKPAKPWASGRDLEHHVGSDAQFELWYLEDRGLVKKDGYRYCITAAGVDFVEASLR
jgi:NOL1/NOP2/fmu family ribosome biogenesis protein